MKIQRRQLLKSFGAISIAAPTLGALSACSPRIGENPQRPPEPEITPTSMDFSNAKVFKPGYLSIIQGPSSDTIVNINMFVPKLKKYIYEVFDASGTQYPVEVYNRVASPTHYHVAKLKVVGLTPGVQYTLNVFDVSRSGAKSALLDQRFFQSLDTKKTQPRFGFVSCMADDIRFDDVIDPMWNRLKDQDVDFLFLTGDLVYVDSFETVERQLATEFDIWQRYIDSFRRIPVYHWTTLKPIFATWDDHDYGTNDGDRRFKSRDSATRLFHALFFADNIENVWMSGPHGTSAVFKAFGQKFILLDDRSFRQPNKEQTELEPYGHWGEEQHKWLIANLAEDTTPAWIFNGNQFFRGTNVTFVESLAYNHPLEHKNFCEEIKALGTPVVFASGDVHLSEVMQIPPDLVGFSTYEITSSSMHSFLGGDGKAWSNSYRIPELLCTEFNFMVIQSEAIHQNSQRGFNIHLQSLGMTKTPYFESRLEVLR